MNNIRQFSSKEDIQEQACLWISRLDRELSDDEKAQLDVWLAESPNHRKALMEAASLWDDMSVLNELSGLFPHYQNKTETKAHNRNKRRVGIVTQTRMSVAAAFLVMAIAIGVVVDRVWLEEPDVVAHVAEKIETGIGEQKNLVLSDGSTLLLNTNSRVTVDFSDKVRNIVLLKGEAHFEVAHDTTRPFTVTAGNNTVTAVGTAFNMQYVDDNAFELVVTDGKVLVKDRFSAFSGNQSLFSKAPVAGEGQLMFAGEKATIKGDVDARESLSQDDIDDDLAWQQGMIVFKGERLEAVLAEIGRYTQVHFQISDESLKSRRVAGYFKVGDIDGLLAALKNSFNIDYEKVSDTSIQLSVARG
ncbi:FecR domain-containing protein [Alteromonas sp. 1_MG-2023]|uniref:FecR family protein n=1 Tax=Alteromonas sp. 1_MG-2023 TaxID=3062669 RepID=UPI0026E30291|nr:FecR domain-containing protein [Alteromonas sp. 1_MG-2023]MDO6567131.1 FecR domain-containing protein [Alteromonas sp. 1_MG-2023]